MQGLAFRATPSSMASSTTVCRERPPNLASLTPPQWREGLQGDLGLVGEVPTQQSRNFDVKTEKPH